MKMKLFMTSVLSTSLLLTACGGGSSDDSPATTDPSGTPANNIKIQWLKSMLIRVLT